MPKKSISQLVLEYFQAHPNEDLKHAPVVDWVEEQYVKSGGTKPRDTWRAIRKLYDEDKLIKVKKGVYRYDPSYVHEKELLDFPPEVKEAIFRRDNYKCVVCGRGKEDGVEICADHRKPKKLGGGNTIDNGQTLCTEHNLLKKKYSQTEAGKRFFTKIYESAIAAGDDKMVRFCKEIFDVYDKEGMNSHISRPNHK
jgi:5-methylcytosine-specific restriction endonuclease McrA